MKHGNTEVYRDALHQFSSESVHLITSIRDFASQLL